MAWTKTTKGKSVLLTETVTIADSGGANATYIPTSVIPNDVLDWEDKKFAVTLKVTETSATDGDVDAYVQTSPNGLTTGDVVTPGSGAHPNWINSNTLLLRKTLVKRFLRMKALKNRFNKDKFIKQMAKTYLPLAPVVNLKKEKRWQRLRALLTGPVYQLR